ncbi:MAG TPA: hypothetical protein VKT53_13235 [Candidatus Acidoferrum sp.]|nr:hypothetical protein [Candidatus Acidoferrum sp.]
MRSRREILSTVFSVFVAAWIVAAQVWYYRQFLQPIRSILASLFRRFGH